VVILSDAEVAPLYAHKVESSLKKAGLKPHLLTVKGGEESKSFAVLEDVLEQLLALPVERGTLLIALGGGVVGDVTGFVASILLRGVPFVQLPTTLLAQVDSSVGGKTGINSKQGKNLIGSFYQPKAVLIDTDSFATLPPRQRRAGFAEVIKYGLIADNTFYDWLKTNGNAVLEGEQNALSHAIARCCQIKADSVAADEREKGQRALLNFGHTFGHAMEKLAGYDGRLLHGEAVAVGMVAATRLSAQRNMVPEEAVTELLALYEQWGMPATLKDLALEMDAKELWAAMQQDKKVEAGRVRFILLRAIGEACIEDEVTPEEVLHILHQL